MIDDPAPAPLAERLPGWYWVRFPKYWSVAHWDGRAFNLVMSTRDYSDFDFEKIGVRIEEPNP